VAVIGAGLLGGEVSRHLGLLGVPLTLIDPDVVAEENLANGSFPETDLGRPKARARARQIQALAPGTPVAVHCQHVEDLGLAALRGHDLLVSAVDGFAARLRIARLSSALAVPMCDAAVDGSGERLLGSVALFDPRVPAAACYGCAFGSDDLARIAEETRQGCPSWMEPARAAAPPTLAASSFGGVVGGLQALWCVDALLGRNRDRVSQQLLVQADATARLRSVALSRSRHCTLDHEPLSDLREAHAETLGDLVAEARSRLGREPESLHLHDRSLALDLRCPGCGERGSAVRLRTAFHETELQCACGQQRVPDRFATALSRRELSALSGQRLGELGLPPHDVVSLRAGSLEVHFLVNVDRVEGPSAAEAFA
jgi:molybdopterin/thiamine biosynthesis adenylyltransferase